VIVAVDGGGSGSRVAVFDEDLRLVEAFTGPPLNYAALGRRRFARNVGELARNLSGRRGALILALAGSSRFRGEILEILGKELGGGDITLISDVEAVFMAATRGADGIVVSSGTGSFAYGRLGGREARAGGWGYLFDDEGSAYWIGRETLRLIFAGVDGRVEACETLLGAYLRMMGAATVEETIPVLYREYAEQRKTALLARLACEAASMGSRVARSIIWDAASHLDELVMAVERRLGVSGRVTVYGSGSTLLKCGMLAELLSERIRSRGHEFTLSGTPAVLGCLYHYLATVEGLRPEDIKAKVDEDQITRRLVRIYG